MTLGEVRVLLIDDDEDDHFMIRELLSEMKERTFVVTWKPNYQDGLDALTSGNYDVCLLDHRLGEYTGLDLLRAAAQQGNTTPVILLTGFGDMELDIRAMQVGAADYLVKDKITAPLLERTIRYAIKHALDVQEIKDREESFRTLFNSTFEGIIVHRDGLIADVNMTAAETFGYRTREMVQTPLSKYIQLGAAPANKIMEVPGITKNGDLIPLEVSSRDVNIKGVAMSLVAIRDLTMRKQLESQILQQDRLASLGLLASSLAHEIGTPMGVIRGRAEFIAKKRPDDANLQNDMDLIVRQIERITRLVNSLLHIARGTKSDSVVSVPVKTVVDDVSNLMNHELQRHDIALKIELSEGLTVRAEPGPLGQVLLNLIVNSVHAIDEAKKAGRAAGHAITIVGRADSGKAELSVEDTGCGISDKNLSQLFKPFFTTKDVGLGTGLGLVTSYRLVQSWGGTIQVQSKVGHGTKFTLALSAPS
ncbi:MAG TPA: ATP-binding protein [Bdellovibrionales bacterium]|nr:ATP-binding protein [Bdellovibrionales bacterium]